MMKRQMILILFLLLGCAVSLAQTRQATPAAQSPAGATTEGTILLHFPGLTEQTWKARKSAVLTLNFTHQPPQTVTIP